MFKDCVHGAEREENGNENTTTTTIATQYV